MSGNMQIAAQALFKSISQINLSKYLAMPARMRVLEGVIWNIMQQTFIQIFLGVLKRDTY